MLDCPIEKLEAWSTDGRMIHPTPKTPEGHIDGFALAVISLAGEAFCDELTRLAENDHDKENACRAILDELSEDASRATAEAALEVVEEAARELVKSERFVSLAIDLAGKLAKEHLLLGSEVERFLRQRDPDRRVEAHSQSGPLVAPWYEVTDRDKRLLYRGADEAEASRIQRLHPHSMKVGSIYS